MRVKAQRVFKLGAVLLCVGFFIYSVVINTNDYTSSRLLVNFNQKWGENVDLRPKFIRIPLEIGNSSNSKLDGIVSRYRMIEMVDEPLFKKGEHLAPRAARSPFFFVHGHGGNYSQPDEMIAYLTNTLRRFGIRDAPIAAYTVDLKNEPSAFSDELLVLQAKYYAFAIEKLITMHNFQGDFEPPTEDDSQEIDELRQNVRQVSSILKGARHAGRRKLTLFSLSMGTVIPLLSLSFLRPEYLPFIDTVILLNPPLVHHPFNSWLEDTTVYQNIASFFERTGREQHKYFIDVISYTSGPYDTMVRPEMTSFEFMLKGLKERASPSWRFTNIASRETQDVYLDLQHNELMYDKHFLIKLSKFFISKHFGAVERAPPFFLEGLSPSNEIVLENEDLDEEDCSIVQLHEVTTRLPLRERRYKGPNCLALKLNENTSELHIASNIDPENIKFIVKSTQSAFEYAPEKGIARPVNFTSFRWQRSNGDRLFLRVKKEALRRDSLIYFEQDYSSNRPRFNFNVDSWSLFKTQELILSTKGDRSQFTLGVKTDFANKYLAVKLCVEPLSAAPKNTSSVNLNNLKPYALISFDKETPKPSLLFFDLHEKDCSYFEASESQMFLRGNLYIMSNAELPEVKITITLSPILYIQSLLRNNIKYALAALGFVANLFLFLQIVQQKTCSTLKGYLKVMITQSPLLLSLLILFNVAISFIYRQLFKTGFLGIDNPYYGPYYHFDVIDGVFAAIGSLVLFYMITICGMLVVKVIAKVAGYILTFLGFLIVERLNICPFIYFLEPDSLKLIFYCLVTFLGFYFINTWIAILIILGILIPHMIPDQDESLVRRVAFLESYNVPTLNLIPPFVMAFFYNSRGFIIYLLGCETYGVKPEGFYYALGLLLWIFVLIRGQEGISSTLLQNLVLTFALLMGLASCGLNYRTNILLLIEGCCLAFVANVTSIKSSVTAIRAASDQNTTQS